MTVAIVCDTCERIGYVKESSGTVMAPPGWQIRIEAGWDGFGRRPQDFKWVDATMSSFNPDPFFLHRCPACARAEEGEEVLVGRIRDVVVKELDARAVQMGEPLRFSSRRGDIEDPEDP